MSRAPKPDYPSNVEGIRQLISRSFVAEKKKEPKRDYLGASCWGEECKRKLAYNWHGFEPQESTFPREQMYAITEMGHAGEPIVASMLRAAGFELFTENQKTGKQFAFYEADGKLRGHCDGIILSGPDQLDDGRRLIFPVLWENKLLNNKNWNLARKDGYRKAKPIYYSQINTYGAYFDVPNGALVTCLNRDSGELYVEYVPFDSMIAQESTDRAVAVITSEAPDDFARLSDDPDFFMCRFCDHRLKCHGLENPTLATFTTPPTKK